MIVKYGIGSEREREREREGGGGGGGSKTRQAHFIITGLKKEATRV